LLITCAVGCELVLLKHVLSHISFSNKSCTFPINLIVMQASAKEDSFQIRTADYFAKKAKQAKGTEKLLVALEMSKYLTAAREHGLTFEELKELGFKFATV
jgi:hypothetical protein